MTDSTTKKSRLGFHPKAMLKGAQQKVYSSRYLYLIFCFIVPVILSYIMYVAKGLYPFYDGSVLVLDLNSQYVYFFEALRDAVWGDRSLLYSFARSLGGEFMGIYAYYIASPLSYIVALFPADRIQEAILCMLLLKTGLSGLTFGYFLDKHTKNRRRLSVFMFSLMYALSAYSVVHQNNTMWFDAMILLPLFALGLEKLVLEKKFKLYVLALAAILVSNYYIGYMVCIFAVIYFFYCYFSRPVSERNPNREKLHFWRTGGRFAAFSVLSALISAFMLIAAYYSLGFGKTDFSNPNWARIPNFDVADFFSKLLPGAYDTVEPSGLPFVYCGLLALLMLPVYFSAKRISTREKLASLGVLAIFLLSFFINPIDLIWHGFSRPNWLNARYSFMFIFFVLVLAYKGFGLLKEMTERFILLFGGLIVLLAAVVQKFEMESYINSNEKVLTLGCVWFSIFFTVALCALICAKLRSPEGSRVNKSITSVIAAVVCAELLCNGIVCTVYLGKDVGFASYSSYKNHMDDLRPIVEQLSEYDSSFYRFEKTKHRTKNDNMALDINGLTSSTSTLNADAINFVNRLGYTGRAHLTTYSGGTPFSDSLLGIKYVIDYKDSKDYNKFYTEIEELEFDRFKVMQNPYALSLVFGTDDAVKELDLLEDTAALKRYNFFDRYSKIAEAILGEEDIQLFNPVNEKKYDWLLEKKESYSLNTYITPEDAGGKLTITYTAPYTGSYYFYLPLSPDLTNPDLRVSFSGSDYKDNLTLNTNNILSAGYYNEGSKIIISIIVPKDTELTIKNTEAFLWCLDAEVYEDTMSRILSLPQLEITETDGDDHIFGSLTTTKDKQMMTTTIPYDEGWNVYVDGEKVEIYEALGAMMAFDIETAGEHRIELKYYPDCYRLGSVLTVFGILAFSVLCAGEFLLRKTALRQCRSCFPDENESFLWYLDDSERPLPNVHTAIADENEARHDENADGSSTSTVSDKPNDENKN